MTEEEIKEVLSWKLIFYDEDSLMYKFREEFKRIRMENVNLKKEITELKSEITNLKQETDFGTFIISNYKDQEEEYKEEIAKLTMQIKDLMR